MLPGSREWRKALRSDQEVRWRVKNRRGGAPGGVRAGTTARGRLREVPSCDQRHFGAPLPHANEGRSEGAGPAPTNEGADESRPYVIGTARIGERSDAVLRTAMRGLFDM